VGLHALLLAFPLFFSPVFHYDWINHLWFANYVAHHWVASGVLPMFVNVPSGIGNPILVFYGSGLYATVAPLVLLFGPDWGMRVAVLAAFLIPNLALARFASRCFESRSVAGAVTVVLSTSLYQLTNIYTRSATTEFFAYQFLLFALVLLMDGLLDTEGRARSTKWILGLASASIGALSHPPTVYLAVIFLGIPALIFVVLQRRALVPHVRRPVGAFAVLFVVGLPVTVWAWFAASYSSAVAIQRDSSFYFFARSIDHWLARLLPWPMDFRVEIQGFNFVSTPFLSAPVSLGALVLLTILLVGKTDWLGRRPGLDRWGPIVFIVAIAAAAALSLVASLPWGVLEPSTLDETGMAGMVSATASSWRGRVLGRVQFAYRLVNLTNLALIFGSLAVMVLNAQRRWTSPPGDLFRRERSRVVLIVATTLCTLTACMKVMEVAREFWLLPRFMIQASPPPANTPPKTPSLTTGILEWVSPVSVRQLRAMAEDASRPPSIQYGLHGYSIPSIFSEYRGDRQRGVNYLQFEPRGANGAVARITCAHHCALITNLIPSPFFSLSVDDTVVPLTDLRTRNGFVVVFGEAGDHRLEVYLGTWATRVLAHSIAVVVLVFWATLPFAGRSPRPAA
jgi:hypothetical protein